MDELKRNKELLEQLQNGQADVQQNILELQRKSGGGGGEGGVAGGACTTGSCPISQLRAAQASASNRLDEMLRAAKADRAKDEAQ